jgi:hypothetical protein
VVWGLLTASTAVVPSEQITVMIHQNDATARAEEDTTVGQYYTVQYTLPQGMTAGQLDRAVLEFYVDVRSKDRDGYVDAAPMLEVFAAAGALQGDVDAEDLDIDTRAGRPVALGDGRLVRIDVTKIVRAHVSGNLTNNGIVIGSMTGMREGDFTIATDRFPGGAVARLNIYTKAE